MKLSTLAIVALGASTVQAIAIPNPAADAATHVTFEVAEDLSHVKFVKREPFRNGRHRCGQCRGGKCRQVDCNTMWKGFEKLADQAELERKEKYQKEMDEKYGEGWKFDFYGKIIPGKKAENADMIELV